jgi:hypothetical protein
MKRNDHILFWLTGLFALFLVACGGNGEPASPVEPATPSANPTTAPAGPAETDNAPEPTLEATETAVEEPPTARPQLVEFYADW